jgi:cobalt-zinc-cadmium resistance protein CzcA
MRWLDVVVASSVKHRVWVLVGTLVLVILALFLARGLTFDAFPDLTNTQVTVLTNAPGMASEEVELLVTVPLERSLGGVPQVDELRSLSMDSVSSVTVVFKDGTDLWMARQWVKERVDLAAADLPGGAHPQLGPATTGLGEVVQFTLQSDDQDPVALTRLLERDIAPRLRRLDGVVEVNAWSGGAPRVDIRIDPWALASHKLSLGEVAEAVSKSLAITSGGSMTSGVDRAPVRAVSNPDHLLHMHDILIREDKEPLRLSQVATVHEGSTLSAGFGTAQGEGEAIVVVVQLLAGADARKVVALVQQELTEIRPSLPADVRLEVLYDREKLVGATLETVGEALFLGGLLVIGCLFLVLGDLRAGLIVASVIPLSLLGAFAGLSVLGVSGNLMSLGAVDFGLVVDGTIVVIEAVVALEVARTGDLGQPMVDRIRTVARPVAYGVSILLVVYLPVLAMSGTEGRLFRPMAITVLLALATALVLTFTYVPAISTWFLRPSGHHSTLVHKMVARLHGPALQLLLGRPALAMGSLAALLGVGVLGSLSLGVEFVPRLEEGDLIIQTRRIPGAALTDLRREALRLERVLRRFPEVEAVATRTGAPVVATDPMGLEDGDVLVRLRPRHTWTTADTTEGLASAFAAAIAHDAPGAELTLTQPIEMRFNELLEGIPSDVGVQVMGHDLSALRAHAEAIAQVLRGIPGAADVHVPGSSSQPALDVRVDERAVAQLRADPREIHAVVAAQQAGVRVGTVLRGAFRDPVVLTLMRPSHVSLADMPVVLPGGGVVTLGDVAEVRWTERPVSVRRLAGNRRLVVQANVRGRDIGGFVAEAKTKVQALRPPEGVWTLWAGKAEQLADAAFQTSVLVPLAGLVLVALLVQALGSFRPTFLVLVTVPAALVGGILALLLRGMPLSMSAVVGFIALAGVAVMNALVLVSRVIDLEGAGAAPRAAAGIGAVERLRPVMMTALVAGVGFLPMAFASGVGAEVQRPLATVVIGGLLTATPATLLLLPALLGVGPIRPFWRTIPPPSETESTG